MVALTMRSSIQSSNNATTFETSSFLTTNLANIQRETLLLIVETERYLNDPDISQEALELRRALLANQLRVQFVRSALDESTEEHLSSYLFTLDEYDRVLTEMRVAGPTARTALATQMRDILPRLDLELKILYDQEEQSFLKRSYTAAACPTNASFSARWGRSPKTCLAKIGFVRLPS